MADYTQENRRLAINTPLGVDVLLLTDFEAEEEFSRLFSFQLRMLSEQDEIVPADLVGQNVTITCLDADDEPRYFNGYVREFSNQGHGDRGTIYTAHIVPGLWFLTRRRNCRMFQEMSVVEILQEVFDTAGLTDYDLAGVQGSYDTLEYCVQYEETDFAFVSRLMEEFGIFYFFTHEDGKHTLMLADSTSAYQPAKHDTARFAGPLSFDELNDNLTAWTHRYEYRSGKIAVADFNFKKPEAPIRSRERTVVDLTDNKNHELYSYPGRYTERAQGDQVARIRMEAEETDHNQVVGASKLRSFAPGFTFSIEDHHQQAEVGKSYVLTKVIHQVNAGSYVSGGATPEGYGNTFTCIPADVPFRPERVTPKARVEGPQTAIIVGPPGEDIYTDEFGRVKVKFHWDRTEHMDDKSSCWVRVSQTWAGKGWGAMHIPRIGQEVIIEFLEGDPDRPIITGRVYNGANGVPFDLPANKTISGLKSDSSLGGGGSNELHFEDKKGEELVYIHAQKNEHIVVENNKTEHVGHDETLSVGNDRKRSVGNDESVRISVNRTHDVGSNETISVGQDRKRSVGRNESVNVGADRTHGVNNNETISIGKNQSTSVGENQTTTVAKNISVTAGKTISIDAGDEITISTGKATIQMKKDGTIKIKGKDITVEGSGKINAKASKDIVMKGKKILQN